VTEVEASGASPPALFAALDAEREAERVTPSFNNGWPANSLVNGNGSHPAPVGEIKVVTDKLAYGRSVLVAECNEAASTPPGDRNNRLNKAAFRVGQLIGCGAISLADAQTHLTSAAQACGLPEGPSQSTIASGLRGGQADPRMVREVPRVQPQARTRPAATTRPADDWPAAPTAPGPVPYDDIWNARPKLAHVHAYARARMGSPWAVLGVVLAKVVVNTPYAVYLPPTIGVKASLNLFVALVAPSGGGKGIAYGIGDEAFAMPKVHKSKTGSGEGFAHSFLYRKPRTPGTPPPPAGGGGDELDGLEWRYDSHAILFSVSEVDLMGAQASRQGATLMPELRAAWSGEALGTSAYADATRRVPVPEHEYRLCLLLQTQPHRSKWLLEDADGGTPLRFLWLPATDPDIPDELGPLPTRMGWTPPLVTKELANRGGEMPVCETATSYLQDNFRVATRRSIGQGKDASEDEALAAHSGLTRLKVAAALAILEGRLNVNDEDWWLSGLVMARSDATRAEIQQAVKSRSRQDGKMRAVAEAHHQLTKETVVNDKHLETATLTILRHLRGASEPKSESDLRKVLSTSARTQLGPALARLISDQAVIKTGEGTGAVYTIKE
jgi:hypothetical protein